MKFSWSIIFRYPSRTWVRYTLALAGTAVALALRGLLDPILTNYVPYLTVFPAVIFSAWYCGLWPSVMAAVLSTLGEIYWYIEPRHSFGISVPAEAISLVVYVAAAGVVVVLSEANRRSVALANANLREARAARNLFEKFMDNSPVAAYMTSGDGRYVFCNSVFKEHLQAGDALPGKKGGSGSSLADRPRAYDSDVLTEGKSLKFVETGPQGDSWLTTKFPISDGSGHRFVGGISMDITERRRFEEHLRKAHEELEVRVLQRTAELARKNEELAEQTETVRELSTRLLEMRDQERRHIARELHDGIGQVVAAMKMNLARVTAESKALGEKAASALAESISLTDQLSSDIRTLSHLLHPPLLDELGLNSALRWYVEGFAERSKILVSLELPQDSTRRLPRDLELHLFRIVQECLTNIHRHSGSPTASVRLVLGEERIKIEIADQGKGIPKEKQLGLKSKARVGVGISGMRERVKQFGGVLEIESGPNGTTVSAALPLEKIQITSPLPFGVSAEPVSHPRSV